MLFVQLGLKILWSNSFLGLSIDQYDKRNNLPVTNYYFWPKTEAWEQLKVELDFKPWVQEKEKIKILNSATEVMNFWQVNRNNDNLETVKNRFKNINFVKVST